MSDDYFAMSGTEVAAGVRSRRFTARAVTEALLQRIESLNPSVNAYITVTTDRALKEAAAVDAAVGAGRDPGPLAGVPYSVKNLFDLEGVVTLAGAKINAEYPAASADATSVARLRAAGAICLGATNMGEYAYDFVTVNAHYGATLNPHDPARSAGGSSGGSGASVAAGLCAFSLGTDTNGSIRVPSSFCGLWGLKPTYGRLSRAGGFLFAGSLDTIGVIGRSVRDLAESFDAMSGPDERDPVCWSGTPVATAPVIDSGSGDLRIAKLGGYFARGGEPEVRSAVTAVCEALNVTREIELPQPSIARAAAFIITATEGGELHRERLAERAADFDPSSRDRFIAGALTPAAWYLQAQRFRAWWHREMLRLFEGVDVLIAPATPMVAPLVDQEFFMFDGEKLLLRPNIGLYTQPITLIGLPVVAAPVHSSGHLPAAVQLIGRPHSEAQLLRVARELEARAVCTAPVGTNIAAA